MAWDRDGSKLTKIFSPSGSFHADDCVRDQSCLTGHDCGEAMEQSRIATGEEVVVTGFTLYRVGVRCRGQSIIRKNQTVEQTR